MKRIVYNETDGSGEKKKILNMSVKKRALITHFFLKQKNL